jgi:prolyl 4-hydroxylase
MSSVVLKSSYPGGTRLHAGPDVHTVDGFIQRDEALCLMRIAGPLMGESKVSGDKAGFKSTGRTNSLAWVKHGDDPVIARLAERIADLVGLPLVNAEAYQVIRYDKSQEYRPHFDAYDLSTERGQRCCARGGQRLVTVLGYLTPVEAGGATRFPNLDLNVAPDPGRLLIFHNCHAGSNQRHPNSLHQGTPVELGRKWAFNLWFHERQFQNLG